MQPCDKYNFRKSLGGLFVRIADRNGSEQLERLNRNEWKICRLWQQESHGIKGIFRQNLHSAGNNRKRQGVATVRDRYYNGIGQGFRGNRNCLYNQPLCHDQTDVNEKDMVKPYRSILTGEARGVLYFSENARFFFLEFDHIVLHGDDDLVCFFEPASEHLF